MNSHLCLLLKQFKIQGSFPAIFYFFENMRRQPLSPAIPGDKTAIKKINGRQIGSLYPGVRPDYHCRSIFQFYFFTQ